MRALTLWQPWAQLVVSGQKRIETRSWKTRYRGPLVITAASRWSDEQLWTALGPRFREALGIEWRAALERPRDATFLDQLRVHVRERLPLGCALGIVELVHVLPIDRTTQTFGMDEEHWMVPPPRPELERGYGDYTPGRYAWLLARPAAFPEPIPCSGRQRLWRPSGELRRVARRMIARRAEVPL